MNRKEKIYLCIKNLSSNLELNSNKKGFTTEEISKELNIDRSNVSRELNVLSKEGKVSKIKGRPVLYLDKSTYDKFNNVKDIKSEIKKEDEDVFKSLIGSEGSLSKIIQLAKAAIMYPPRGLHSMLIGPTGSGKTTFVELMYKYAIENNVIGSDSELIIFNCAEYANNPQLLLSQLFGYVKGSFTGAEKNKVGLVEKAQNGILFLDEIHRLPYEGQEMLFTLIDKNIYKPLGETGEYKEANVLIIGATTEDLDSVMLNSFLRRIPMVIEMPPLNSRSIKERYNLIKSFFDEEARRVKVPFIVNSEVIKALLFYECKGNIGQLKSDVRLICAKGFLNYKTTGKKNIEIFLLQLPENILNDYKCLRTKNIEKLSFSIKDKYKFTGKHFNEYSNLNDLEEDIDIYEQLNNSFDDYIEQGYNTYQINKELSNKINRYFSILRKRFSMSNSIQDDNELFKIISPKVLTSVKRALENVEKELNRQFDRKALISIALHISVILEQLDENRYKPRNNENINDINFKSVYKNEYKAALLFLDIVFSELEHEIPISEIHFIAMFFSKYNNVKQEKIGVLILSHGKSTATSMANVVNKLLHTDHCKSLDMPLEEKVETFLEKTILKVKEIDKGMGVILLVDMGSLFAFGELITKQTGINVRVIEMVSTPIVLECVRRVLMKDTDLETLSMELQNITPYKGRFLTQEIKKKIEYNDNDKIILTMCITGKGTAIKLKDYIETVYPDIYDYGVNIIPVDMNDKNWIYNNNVIAVVGANDTLTNDKYYISIDDLVAGNGIEKLKKIIQGEQIPFISEALKQDAQTFKEVLSKTLVFLNPDKAFSRVNSFYNSLVESEIIHKDYERICINLTFHVCYMIERLLSGEFLTYNNINKTIKNNKELYLKIKKYIEEIEDVFGITVPDTEIGFIIDLINTQKNQ